MTNIPARLLFALVVASTASAARGSGQDAQRPPNVEQPQAPTDSLPFRRGQWGAEFAVNDGTLGLGALRFRSPRTAWLLDASVGASWAETEGLFAGDDSETNVFVSLRAGLRSYRPLATGAAAYVGTGLIGSYAWAADGSSRRRMWQAGVFGHLGAVYFVTRRLSLGARGEAAASYSASRQTSPSVSNAYTDRRFSIALSPVRIIGALYF